MLKEVKMATEIERKFLVNKEMLPKVEGKSYVQGYLSSTPDKIVRIRIAGDKGILTIKGKAEGAEAISRPEYEYEIPLQDAKEMMDLCEKPLIEKIRYEIKHEGHLWEVDEFIGDNKGLIVAEIELVSESEKFVKPDWVKEEVSNDARYANSNLVKHPFSKW